MQPALASSSEGKEDPAYYARFGFTPAAPLVMPGVPPQNVLVIALDGTVPSATVAFHPAFAAE